MASESYSFRFSRTEFLLFCAIAGTPMPDAALASDPSFESSAIESSNAVDSVQRPSYVPPYAAMGTVIDSIECTTELEPDFDPDLYETRTVFVWTPNEVLDRWPPFSIRLSEADRRRLGEESPALAMALLSLDTASENRIHPFDIYDDFRLVLPTDLSPRDVEVRNEGGTAHWYRTRNVLERTSDPERTIIARIEPDPPRGSKPPSWLSIRIDEAQQTASGQTRTESYVVRLHEEPTRQLVVSGSDGWMAGEFEIHTIYTARGPIRLASR